MTTFKLILVVKLGIPTSGYALLGMTSVSEYSRVLPGKIRNDRIYPAYFRRRDAGRIKIMRSKIYNPSHF